MPRETRNVTSLPAGFGDLAIGLAGRARRAGSASERARQSVTKTIKAVVERIGQSDAALGDIFLRCIKTGNFCSYQPDPNFPIAWEFAATATDTAIESTEQPTSSGDPVLAHSQHRQAALAVLEGLAVLVGGTNRIRGARNGRRRDSRGYRSCASRPRIGADAL